MVSPNVGAKRYLVMGTESSWGTLPGTPYYVHVPVDDYTVKFAPVNRQNNPFSGLLQRKHSRNIKGMPAEIELEPLALSSTAPATSMR